MVVPLAACLLAGAYTRLWLAVLACSGNVLACGRCGLAVLTWNWLCWLCRLGYGVGKVRKGGLESSRERAVERGHGDEREGRRAPASIPGLNDLLHPFPAGLYHCWAPHTQ